MSLWSKVKHGGTRCALADDNNDDGSSEKHVGWSKFFDGNVHSTSVEKKSSCHAIPPDSCVSALRDNHASASQCSSQGLLWKEVFDNDFIRQLSEMKFFVVDALAKQVIFFITHYCDLICIVTQCCSIFVLAISQSLNSTEST